MRNDSDNVVKSNRIGIQGGESPLQFDVEMEENRFRKPRCSLGIERGKKSVRKSSYLRSLITVRIKVHHCKRIRVRDICLQTEAIKI